MADSASMSIAPTSRCAFPSCPAHTTNPSSCASLNPKSISVPLESLGIPPKLLAILLKEIDKPNGMILTTGPTGSGKTTTLYAFLKKVIQSGRENNNNRRSRRISFAGHHSDPGQRQGLYFSRGIARGCPPGS